MSESTLWTIIAGVFTVFAITIGAIYKVLTSLWNIRGAWDRTNLELKELVKDVRELVTRKDADHRRLEQYDEKLERRIERHEEWHGRQPPPRRL